MKKIKVFRIIARLNIGGPAIHVLLLSDGINRRSFSPLLVFGKVGSGEAEMPYPAAGSEVKTYVIPQLKRQLNPLLDLIAGLKIYLLLLCERPEIIHTHTAKAGTLGRIAGVLYKFIYPRQRVVLVHTFHGHIFGGYFNKAQSALFLLIERTLGRFSHKIIAVSDRVRKELVALKVGSQEKIVVIRLGFELERFLRLAYREPGEFTTVGIVGRLVPVKNHRLFLDAAAQAVKYNSHLRFQVVGDGELRKELEDYVYLLSLASYVTFTGWQKDLVGVYSGFDVVCLTSLNEGTPVSLIEAMASARPVVATDAGGVSDLLGGEIDSGFRADGYSVRERGVLVTKNNPFSFCGALLHLVNDVMLQDRMKSAGRDFAAKGFTKERMIRDMEKLYISLKP
jgi:glycosyltransferase involved in cell wall biosynthesis